MALNRAPKLTNTQLKDGVYYPETVADLKELIQHAKANSMQIRTIGAGHSPAASISDKDNPRQILINLDGEFRKVQSFTVDDSKEFATVKVGAGCNLGINPSDKRSTAENSFNQQMDAKGYALPTLGGISHQTIAGFMQTSSSGGTTKHNIADVVEEIELVDGNGEVRTFKKGDPEFNAAGVAMGMFGVMTNVTFKLPKRYLVEGTEQNKEFKDSFLAKDEKGNRTELRKALTDNEYIHINWLPQKNVNRTMQWTGRAVDTDQKIIPYQHTLQSKLVEGLAKVVLWVGNVIDMFADKIELLENLKGEMLKLFADPKSKQDFRDVWYKALPIDDQADVDRGIKLLFSEMWFPYDQIDRVMNDLEDLFKNNPRAAGNFIVELYCAQESPFWLSPSNGGKSFRVDLYWWDKNIGKAENYFGIFWDKLGNIPGARYHWGKFLPVPGTKYGDKTFTSQDLSRNYPKFAEWQTMREKMDPAQLFVTPYWRQVLNIPVKPALQADVKVEPAQPVKKEVVTPAVTAAAMPPVASEGYLWSALRYMGLYSGSASGNVKTVATNNAVQQPKPPGA